MNRARNEFILPTTNIRCRPKSKSSSPIRPHIAMKTFFVGCPVRFLENRDVAEGVVNGAIGKFNRISERGKQPTIQLKSGKPYTLTRSSASIYLDEYTTYERHMIQSGRLRADSGRPVAKFTYSYYRVKMALAMMPYACQGCTMDTAIIHPNVEYDNAYTVIECVYVALSRLRSSGVDKPDKPETTRVVPKPTMLPCDNATVRVVFDVIRSFSILCQTKSHRLHRQHCKAPLATWRPWKEKNFEVLVVTSSLKED